MSDKLEALSQPVAWTDEVTLLHMGDRKDNYFWPALINPDDVPFYSQEYVTALLAENAELKSKIENPVVLVGNSKKSIMSVDDAVRRIKFAGFNVEVKKP